MEYTVVSVSRSSPNKALKELITEVNQMIAKGWKPIGGVSFSMWGLMTYNYHQAMVYQPETEVSSDT
jgi:hypothetical protein